MKSITAIKEEFKKIMVEKGSRRVEIKNGDNEPYINKIRKFMIFENKTYELKLCCIKII